MMFYTKKNGRDTDGVNMNIELTVWRMQKHKQVVARQIRDIDRKLIDLEYKIKILKELKQIKEDIDGV